VRRKTLATLLMLLLLPMTLTGCWDRFELEELAFVLLLGIDKGQQDAFAVTAMIAIPNRMAGSSERGGGGGGSKERPYLITTVEGPTVAAAVEMLGGYIDRRISVDHATAAFMGEELAREGVMQAMDALIRHWGFRRTNLFVVVKGTAKEFLNKATSDLEQNPQRHLEKIAANYRQYGLLPAHGQIHHFVTHASTHYLSPVTYYAALKTEDSPSVRTRTDGTDNTNTVSGSLPREGGPNLEFVGAAVFRGDKMVGVLTGEENRLLLMVQGRFARGILTIPDPNDPQHHITLDVRRGRPVRISADLSGSHPRITGRIALEAQLFETSSGIDYTEPELQEQLEEAFEKYLERRLRELIRKTQDWGTDIFGFGYYVARRIATVPEWLAYEWPERYPDAEVDIAVEMTLRRFGTQISPPFSTE